VRYRLVTFTASVLAIFAALSWLAAWLTRGSPAAPLFILVAYTLVVVALLMTYTNYRLWKRSVRTRFAQERAALDQQMADLLTPSSPPLEVSDERIQPQRERPDAASGL